MKVVTFTGPCGGIGAVYNKGDVAVFDDATAAAIAKAKCGTLADYVPPKPETPAVEEKKDAS